MSSIPFRIIEYPLVNLHNFCICSNKYQISHFIFKWKLNVNICKIYYYFYISIYLSMHICNSIYYVMDIIRKMIFFYDKNLIIIKIFYGSIFFRYKFTVCTQFFYMNIPCYHKKKKRWYSHYFAYILLYIWNISCMYMM